MPRIHHLGIPHTITSNEKKWVTCAFTQKVYKLSYILTALLGYTVYHYGHEDSDVLCSEHIPVVSQSDWNYTYGDLDVEKDHYKFSMGDYVNQTFFKNVEIELRKRVQKDDLVLFNWNGHEPLMYKLSDLPVHFIEPGVGYQHTFAPHRVYESYWKFAQDTGKKDERCNIIHDLKNVYPDIENYLKHGSKPYTQPNLTDEVIYNYWDITDFPDKPQAPEDYALFIGRIVWTKGLDIAMRVCAEIGLHLKIAGQGWDNFEHEYKFKPYGDYEYLGTVGIQERSQLMSKARMTFVPTRYPEPFGGVHAESLFSWRPVITSNHGVFPEVIRDYYNGFRCNYFDDYLYAAENIDKINPNDCRDWAESNYSLESAALKYDRYFRRILHLANTEGNYWHLSENRIPLDHHRQDLSYDEIKAKRNHIAQSDPDNHRYNPGGSVKGNDKYLFEADALDYVIESFDLKSVLDLGAGEGHISKYFANKGLQVTAIDADTIAIQNSVHDILHHDLRSGDFASPAVDLVYCVEVLEHIPQKYLPNVQHTIENTKARYLWVSAAKPKQIGYGHINLKDDLYWIKFFESFGYQIDWVMTQDIRNLSEYQNMKNNALFFSKIDDTDNVE